MSRVAFQGERGAFSEAAVLRLFADAESLTYPSLADVFEAVAKDKARFGVVPVENSQAGSINEAYDLLLKFDLNIYAELDLEINHCLMALPGEALTNIKKVYSHPQALAQCEEFLRGLGAEFVPTYDTAASAKMITEQHLSGCAAVASKQAAEIYHLEVLAANIQTNPNNYTKFVAISKEKAAFSPSSKTSLVFATKNVPGALYSCLGAFATRNINLTKLESRPSREKPWEYVFYVDFEGHIEDEVSRAALADLTAKTSFLKILGSYPRSVTAA